MRRSAWLLFGLTALILLQAACSSIVPATITRSSPVPLERDGGVWVMATRERAAIVKSLQNAGIIVAKDFGEAHYFLNVRVGSSRGGSGCGSVHNVTYILTLTERRMRLMVIKGRGRTGSCKPSVFDNMSQALSNSML